MRTTSSLAIVRPVSPTIAQCELMYLRREPIDVERAQAQHVAYVQRLRELGVEVVTAPAAPELPDAAFVEDAAVALDEIALIARPGVESRRAELGPVAEVLRRYRPLAAIEPPGTLEGGDIVRAGRVLFAGVSRRTNREGVEQLRRRAAPLGYEVRPVGVSKCLHLKSACSYVGDDTLLVDHRRVDARALAGFRLLDAAPGEPRAANAVLVGDTVLMPDGVPATRDVLERAGRAVETVDISELRKAEAGVSCLGIFFEQQVE